MTAQDVAVSGPSRVSRILVAVALGLLCGALAFWRTSHSLDEPGGDFWQHWAAARAVLAGADPYTVFNPSTLRVAGDPTTAMGHWYFYPLPAVMLGMPFVWLSPSAAAGVFIALSTAAFTFVVTRREFGAVAICCSTPFILCVTGAQSPPAIIAAALVPALQGFVFLKPNIGLPLLAARPSRWAIIGGALLGFAAFILNPAWPREWLSNIAKSPFHRAPIAWWYGGPLLLLGALKWRRQEARLFLLLACIPQVPLFYDQLPLALIAETERERLVFAWCSWAAYLGWVFTSSHGRLRTADMHDAPPWILVLIFAPTLVMVLRRPNEGDVPAWLERKLAGVPRWLRGKAIPA